MLVTRCATIAGAALLCVHAAREAFPTRTFARLAVAAILLCASPWVVASIEYGNVAALVAAITVVALTRVEERPVTMGVLVGVALLVKPAALGALGVLALAPGRLRPPFRFFAAAAGAATIGLGSTGALVFDWLAQRQFLELRAGGNLAVARALGLVSGGVMPNMVAPALVLAIAIATVRRFAESRRHAVAIALWASVFCVPRVWLYSMTLLVPTIAVAGARSIDAIRRRAERPEEAIRGLTAVLAITTLAAADSLGDWPSWPSVAQGALVAAPSFAAYWLALRLPAFARSSPCSGAPSPPVSRAAR
jgi:hypothetical protein